MALNISDGEAAVLSRLANGYRRKEIAAELEISLSTVNNRIYDAQKRTGLRTSDHLLAWYVRGEVEKLYESAPETPAAH